MPCAPRLADLRLLGASGSAALVGSDASILWWCRPRLDDDPSLWQLLDPAGSAASWVGATPMSNFSPASPTVTVRPAATPMAAPISTSLR